MLWHILTIFFCRVVWFFVPLGVTDTWYKRGEYNCQNFFYHCSSCDPCLKVEKWQKTLRFKMSKYM